VWAWCPYVRRVSAITSSLPKMEEIAACCGSSSSSCSESRAQGADTSLRCFTSWLNALKDRWLRETWEGHLTYFIRPYTILCNVG